MRKHENIFDIFECKGMDEKLCWDGEIARVIIIILVSVWPLGVARIEFL